MGLIGPKGLLMLPEGCRPSGLRPLAASTLPSGRLNPWARGLWCNNYIITRLIITQSHLGNNYFPLRLFPPMTYSPDYENFLSPNLIIEPGLLYENGKLYFYVSVPGCCSNNLISNFPVFSSSFSKQEGKIKTFEMTILQRMLESRILDDRLKRQLDEFTVALHSDRRDSRVGGNNLLGQRRWRVHGERTDHAGDHFHDRPGN